MSLPNILSLSSAIADMIETVRPGVVVVEAEDRGAGAGVIWQANGGILTNAHVVANEGRGLCVRLHDGRTFEARVAGANPALDLAMLRVEATDLPAALIGESAQLRVGEPVWAIGHPWGQPWVVTDGIVSAIGSFKVGETGKTAPFIRTDVRLRPGNSGGPLVNAQGHVLGLNALILGGDQAVAIPSQVAAEWLAGQPTRRIKLGLGVRPIEIEPALAHRAQVEQPVGLLVVNVERDSLAETASLMIGDVLIDVAGTPVTDADELLNLLAQNSSRKTLPLRLIRGGQVRAVEVPVKPHALERWV